MQSIAGCKPPAEMEMPASQSQSSHGYLLATGFGTAAAMWTCAYILRFPPALSPSWLVLVVLGLCLLAGGHIAAQLSGKGPVSGLYTGMLSAVLNLLILGSVLGEDMAAALIMVPATIVISGIIGLAGAATGAGLYRADAPPINWTVAFGAVAVFTTLLLVAAGGLVTSNDAGLAVVDWPNTEGQLMFLYPLAKMTGGIYFEHAHRLIGTLVGLTTLALAVHYSLTRLPRWTKATMWFAFVLVVVQGLLGGLRVTGVEGAMSMTTDPALTAPSITLAIVHGVVGQIFLALLVALAIFASWKWRDLPQPAPHPSASFDRSLSTAVTALLIIQLVFGAIQRHVAGGLHIHITLAVIVLLAAITLGVRLWGIYNGSPFLQRTGVALNYVAAVQLLLGIAALVATGVSAGHDPQPAYSYIIATLHQTTGAALLGLTVFAAVWVRKLAGADAINPA